MFQAWNHRSDAFFPHNLDIRWRRKIISSTFVDQTTFEKLGGEASTIIHSPSHSLRCRYWCYCDDESVYQRFCQGPLVSVLCDVVRHGFWFESLIAWMPDLLRLHLRTSRPRLALAALPASLQAGTGDNWRHEAMSIKLWCADRIQIGSFGIRQLLLLFFFMLNIY